MENLIEETVLDNKLPEYPIVGEDSSPLPAEDYTKKGILKVKCKCGNCVNISDDVIEDGLSWTMLIGNEHFLTLTCDKCKSELTMYIEEILENDAISEESNEE